MRVPTAVGLNLIEVVQLAAAARVVPQVFAETMKSVALVPVTLTLVMVMAALPLLVSVTDFAAPVWPSATLAQLREVGDTVVWAEATESGMRATSAARRKASAESEGSLRAGQFMGNLRSPRLALRAEKRWRSRETAPEPSRFTGLCRPLLATCRGGAEDANDHTPDHDRLAGAGKRLIAQSNY